MRRVLYEKSLPTKNQAGPSSSEKKAEQALFWVLRAVRPLTRDEYFMVQDDVTESMDRVSEVQISKICHNFLFLSDEGTVTLSHSSARDYLTLKFSGQVKQFLHADNESINMGNADKDVLRCARETSLRLANSRICTDCLEIFLDSKNWTKEGSKGSPLLTYACKFWPKHASLCNDKYIQDEILTRIKILFHVSNYDTFRRWVSVFHHDDLELYQWSKEPDPLYYAVILGMPDIVQFCFDQGSSATGTCKGGEHGFPLQTACYLGNMEIFSMMLSKGDINSVDNVYGTPLQASIAGKQNDVAISLITNFGADVNLQRGPFGTAQQMALALNDLDLFASLGAHGARMNDKNGRGHAWATAWQSDYARIQKSSAIEELTQQLTFWENSFERMREDDPDYRSFIPATISWLLLLFISIYQIEDVETMELVDYVSTSIGRHESFLNKYPDHGKHSAVGRVIAEYFTQVLGHLLSMRTSTGPLMRTLKRFKLEKKGGKEKMIKSLSQLGAQAIALEDSYVAEREADDNKAWQQNIKSSMDDMKGEIKEMRETILDLKQLWSLRVREIHLSLPRTSFGGLGILLATPTSKFYHVSVLDAKK
ncbi:ankyrin repeat-containing protein [Penicillium herquei]|nr:ankyrin repeat-containing protein [Penicillium herquei]